MNKYLILKLDGVMQSWGGHTLEERRHSEQIPTRSALLGLLAGCLGIDRQDVSRLEALSASLYLTVRTDNRLACLGRSSIVTPQKITDYHTILEARTVSGKPRSSITQSWREYLCDSPFTVAIHESDCATISIEELAIAVKKPVYTPFLGRRSCPISRPLFHAVEDAPDAATALQQHGPIGGAIYSEEASTGAIRLMMRDAPIYGRKRQFSSRAVWIHKGEEK